MPSGALHAHATLIGKGDSGSPEMFTTIAEVGSITGPTLTRDIIDVTNQDSAGAYREFIGGLIDPGELSFDINYIPTDATQDATTGIINEWHRSGCS